MTKSVTKHTIKASITVLTTAGLVLSTNTGAATVAATVNDSGDTNVTKTLSCERIIDHSSSNSDTSLNTNKWYSVNDNVMGGRSVGTFTAHADHLRFHGSINTNGGGFTSIRHDVDARQFTGTDRIRLAIQSDGRAYHVTLQDKNNRQQSTSHRLPIPTSANDDYEIVELLFKDFIATFRGRKIETVPFDTTIASTVGIILSDSIDGPFELKIAWIDVCRND